MEVEELARRAGLKYISDSEPGIYRLRHGRGFSYKYDSGHKVRSATQLARIRSLVIPPAWNDVWICRDDQGHLQATGRDNKNRKQFLYHPTWMEAASLAKFYELTRLGFLLPRIRKTITSHLRDVTKPRHRVLALMVRLLDLTGIRIGHEEYVQSNGAYGLTTLRFRHVTVRSTSVEFKFPGKSGKQRQIRVAHKETVRVLKETLIERSQPIFGYRDTQGWHSIDAEDVNDYIREISGADFTAKNFRTWLASSHAASELWKVRQIENNRARRHHVVQVTKAIAEKLGNTPAVCRSSYVDPRLVKAYEDGEFPTIYERFRMRRRKWLRREDRVLKHAYQKHDLFSRFSL